MDKFPSRELLPSCEFLLAECEMHRQPSVSVKRE